MRRILYKHKVVYELESSEGVTVYLDGKPIRVRGYRQPNASSNDRKGVEGSIAELDELVLRAADVVGGNGVSTRSCVENCPVSDS